MGEKFIILHVSENTGGGELLRHLKQVLNHKKTLSSRIVSI